MGIPGESRWEDSEVGNQCGDPWMGEQMTLFPT